MFISEVAFACSLSSSNKRSALFRCIVNSLRCRFVPWASKYSTALKQVTEAKKFYDAMQVSLATEDWTVIVQVLVKRKTQTAKKIDVLFKKYVLTDMQGTKIRAVTFNQNVDPLDKLLTPFKRYEISNADLKPVESMYRIGPYPYEWILTANHVIQEIPDQIPYPVPCTFNLARFCELSPFAERNEFINVRALVIGSIPAYGFGDPVRDYILINEEKMPVVLRCWTSFLDNDEVNVSAKFPEPTLIVGMTLMVTTFRGISLATAMYSTNFLIDPPLSDAGTLYQWYKDNKREIAELVTNRAYIDVNRLLPPPKEWCLRSVKQIASGSQLAGWVSVSLQLMPGHGNLWQPVCSSCNKFFKGKVSWSFKCSNCCKQSKLIARSRLEVYLIDTTGTMAATIYTPHVEKIIAMTATELHEADIKGESLIEQVEKLVNGKKVVCFVRAIKNEQNRLVVQLYTENELLAIEKTQLQAIDPEIMFTSPEKTQKERSEFFTPSLAAALEETKGSSSLSKQTTEPAPLSKRNLKFGSLEAPSPENSPIRDVVAVASSPQVQAAQSPIKKSKIKKSKKNKAHDQQTTEPAPLSKRNMKFGSLEAPSPENSPIRDVVAVASSPQVQAAQSPIKKSKIKKSKKNKAHDHRQAN